MAYGFLDSWGQRWVGDQKKFIWDQKIMYFWIKKNYLGSKNNLLKASKASYKRNGGCKRSEMQQFWPFASSKYQKNTAFLRISEFPERLQILFVAAVLRFQRLERLYTAAFLSFQRLQIRKIAAFLRFQRLEIL